jgi:iron complex transport system permease protein
MINEEHLVMRSQSSVRTGLAVNVVAALALCCSIVVAVGFGASHHTAAQVYQAIAQNASLPELSEVALNDIDRSIVWQLRLPRVLTAAFVGAGLAISGVIMQALTRNAMADPYLLGLSSGASLGAVCVLMLGLTIALPLAAFAGAIASLVLTLLLASAIGAVTPSRTVLAGLAVSAGLSALTSFVIFWTAQGDSYREVLGWLLGSLAGSSWDSVTVAVIALTIGAGPVLTFGRLLDGFAFGDTLAHSIGLNVPAIRWTLLIASALLTGGMVAVSGSIGFVGLMVPNAVRLIIGARHGVLIPASACVGAVFLVWADTFARTIFSPQEVPVGILTALIGAPVFAMLLLRRNKAFS